MKEKDFDAWNIQKKKIHSRDEEILFHERDSVAILSQVRLISSKRLLRKMRMIPEKEFMEIVDKIKKFFPELA